MPALDIPRMLVEHNGFVSVEINNYEPAVAEGRGWLPAPSTFTEEGRTGDAENRFGRYTFKKIIKAVVDDLGRVTQETVYEEGTTGEATTTIEREWDGTDYEEQGEKVQKGESVSGAEFVPGYRRSIDDNTLEVMYQGKKYWIKKRTNEDGGSFWEATEEFSLVRGSTYDSNGRVLFSTHGLRGERPKTNSYIYASNGNLMSEQRSSNWTIGGEQQTIGVDYQRSSGGRLITINEVDLFTNEDAGFRQERRYDQDGRFWDAETANGYPDVKILYTRQWLTYPLPAATNR